MIDQNTIQTASLIVNVLVSLILLWTLFEVRNQRKSMYMPDLLIKNHPFKIKKKRDLELSWEFNNASSSDFLLSITNVGFGTAKNINLDWSYDIDKFVKLIQVLDTNKKFNLKKGEDFIELRINNLKSITNLKCIPYFDSFLKNNNDMNIRLPYSYQQLFSIIIFLFTQTPHDSLNRYINQVPKLKLKIEYQDIGGRKITKKYVLDIETIMLKISREKEYTMYKGLLKTK